MLSRCGIKCAHSAMLSYGIDFETSNVEIGDRSLINKGCKFYVGKDNDAHIVIGNGVYIAADTILNAIGHEIGDSSQRPGKQFSKSIIVGDGTWIGCGSIILGGVSIGPGCVIAAGSVVTKDCEENCLYAGVPAKIKRRLD